MIFKVNPLPHVRGPLGFFETRSAFGMGDVIVPLELQYPALRTGEKGVDILHLFPELFDVGSGRRHDCDRGLDIQLLFSPRDGIPADLNAGVYV